MVGGRRRAGLLADAALAALVVAVVAVVAGSNPAAAADKMPSSTPGPSATTADTAPQVAETAAGRDKTGKPPGFPHGTWSLQIENDRIARTDRHYTNGLRIAWVSDGHSQGPGWARQLLQKLYPWAPVREGRIGFAFGQNMYTPTDTATRAYVPNDRPYAGWLYASVGLQAETSRPQGQAGPWFDTVDSVELSLGVVGPWALGEQVQNHWHSIIGVAHANGWDNQLHNEPAVNLVFQRRWRPGTYEIGKTGIEGDFIPSLGGSLGNVFTLAQAGLIVRLGQGLRIDYGPPLIRPSLSSLAALEKGPKFAWYVFAGGSGRAVGRNIFLDGNTFRSSHSVDKLPFVGDFLAGFAVVYRGVRVAFTHVMRTREFRQQASPDRYGALVISTRF